MQVGEHCGDEVGRELRAEIIFREKRGQKWTEWLWTACVSYLEQLRYCNFGVA